MCPSLFRLVQLRAYIEKIRPIDKQLAYQINKLLRATAVAQASEAAATTSAPDGAPATANGMSGDDALQYKPNPDMLIPKVPLVGGGVGDDNTGRYMTACCSPQYAS